MATLVLTNIDLHENPWAEPGEVLDYDAEGDLTLVKWPEFPRPVWEQTWTLNKVHPGGRAPAPDAADLAAERAGF